MNECPTASSETFRTEGWTKLHDDNLELVLRGLAEKKTESIHQISEQMHRTFGIGLERFEPERLDEMELGKSLVRAQLRYDPFISEVIQKIGRILVPLLKSQKTYCTRPYNMIHLPSDNSEKGGIHGDWIAGISEFVTAWVPLNDCEMEPLTLIPRTHTIRSRVLFRLTRLPLIRNIPYEHILIKRAVMPKLPLGRFLAWDGRLLHQGNLNRTDAPTVAMVFRFTSEPIMTEPTHAMDEPFIGSSLSDTSISSIWAPYHALYEQIREIELRQQTNRSLQLNAYFAQVLDACDEVPSDEAIRKRLSFALSMLGQRLWRTRDALLYDLGASVLSCENVEAINRTLSGAANRQDGIAARTLSELYLSRYPNAQCESAIRTFAIKEARLLGNWVPKIAAAAPLLVF